jgi:hypothetical protein
MRAKDEEGEEGEERKRRRGGGEEEEEERRERKKLVAVWLAVPFFPIWGKEVQQDQLQVRLSRPLTPLSPMDLSTGSPIAMHCPGSRPLAMAQ